MAVPAAKPGDWRDFFVARFWLRRRLHLVLLIWAMVYLPGLGSLEIKGEEGRRILPAVTMLQTGNFLVPYVGSEPYFRKPPLVNWIVAASFAFTGLRNEWTARLPSALAILAVAIAFLFVARRALGPVASLLAALVWLINLGTIEKGRLIEIDALYISLTALAFIWWASAYHENKSGLRLWLVPAVFLGLGMLAKGPLPHLLFFYGPVIALLAADRRLRLLATREHVLALAVMFGIFAAWALPALFVSESQRVARIWSRQFSGRVSGVGFQLGSWLTNIPRSFVCLLPWLPLAALCFPASEKMTRNRALLIGITVPFLIVILLPASLPRFATPALGPAAWWFGDLLSQKELRWPTWLGAKVFTRWLRDRIVIAITALACLGMLVYGFLIVPRIQQRDKVRKHARQIDAIVPPNVPVYAVNPHYQPYLFYVRSPIRYASSIDELPPDTQFFLVQPRNESEATGTRHWRPRRPQMVLRIVDYRNEESILFAVPSGGS